MSNFYKTRNNSNESFISINASSHFNLILQKSTHLQASIAKYYNKIQELEKLLSEQQSVKPFQPQ